MSKPRIGITTGLKTADRWVAPYQHAIEQAGGEAVVLRPGDAVPDDLDGLLLSGGGDIDPARYDQPEAPETDGIEPDRDEMEFSW